MTTFYLLFIQSVYSSDVSSHAGSGVQCVLLMAGGVPDHSAFLSDNKLVEIKREMGPQEDAFRHTYAGLAFLLVCSCVFELLIVCTPSELWRNRNTELGNLAGDTDLTNVRW